MPVYLENRRTRETLEVVRAACRPGREVTAPTYVHHSTAWSHWLRRLYFAETVTDQPADWPTVVACTPPVQHGDNEMSCGHLRLYEVRSS